LGHAEPAWRAKHLCISSTQDYEPEASTFTVVTVLIADLSLERSSPKAMEIAIAEL